MPLGNYYPFRGESGIRTHGTVLPVRRFSKPFLSATQAPLLPAQTPTGFTQYLLRGGKNTIQQCNTQN